MSSRPISHSVFFTLNDNSAEAVENLLAECKKYLDDHPGLTYFGCGRLNPDLSREVNDKGYDVSLHTVFADRPAHDAYQISPRHTEFIQNNKATWKQVRVFDSDLES